MGWCKFSLLLLVFISATAQNLKFNKDGTSEFESTSWMEKKFKRKPVVMVPGVLGTQLEAKLNKPSRKEIFCEKKSDWFQIWLNLEQFLPGVVDCWVDNIRMVYNNQTRTVSNNAGVEIRVPKFGSTEAFEYLDTDKYAIGSAYFAPLVNHMIRKLGYKREVDLYGAPFDWRLSPYQHDKFFKNLTKLVETAYYNNNNQKVVVIGHSMGNMFVYFFLKMHKQAWKDKFVDSFASICGPFLGSVKAIKSMISGETEGHDWAVNKLKLRTAVQSSPAFPFMFPRPDLWPKDKQTVVVTLERNYTIHDYKDLFDTIGCDWCYDLWKDNGMALGNLEAPSVPVHCIYSSQVPTAQTLIYDKDIFPDETPTLVDASGDGTVPVWSASYCLKWQKQQTQPVYKVDLPGNTHVAIMGNKTLHQYFDGVLIR